MTKTQRIANQKSPAAIIDRFFRHARLLRRMGKKPLAGTAAKAGMLRQSMNVSLANRAFATQTQILCMAHTCQVLPNCRMPENAEYSPLREGLSICRYHPACE